MYFWGKPQQLRTFLNVFIQVLDEHAATKKVWKIVNPVTEIDDNWHDGQVWIEALEPNINYWVIRLLLPVLEYFQSSAYFSLLSIYRDDLDIILNFDKSALKLRFEN